MQETNDTTLPLVLDLGRASVETKGPYTEGPIEIMGCRAPIGLSDD